MFDPMKYVYTTITVFAATWMILAQTPASLATDSTPSSPIQKITQKDSSTANSATESGTKAIPLNDNQLVIQTATGSHTFIVELALDDAMRAKGLMYRTKMAADHGMLFDFGVTQPIYMWMKNTYLPLDMVFINEDGTVHHLVEETTPLSKTLIGSGGAIRYVLEVKAGTAKKINLKKGDQLRHNLFTPK